MVQMHTHVVIALNRKDQVHKGSGCKLRVGLHALHTVNLGGTKHTDDVSIILLRAIKPSFRGSHRDQGEHS